MKRAYIYSDEHGGKGKDDGEEGTCAAVDQHGVEEVLLRGRDLIGKGFEVKQHRQDKGNHYSTHSSLNVQKGSQPIQL